jgi:hypothetical protein
MYSSIKYSISSGKEKNVRGFPNVKLKVLLKVNPGESIIPKLLLSLSFID